MKKTFLTLSLIVLVVLGFAANKTNSNDKAKTTESAVIPVNSLSISGKVIDFNTGEALTGVELTIEGSSKKVYTDFDGKFKIENIQRGEYNLIASFISYDKSYIEKLVIEKSAQNLNIKLQSTN